MDGLLALKIAVALAPAPMLLALFAFLDVFRLMSLKELAVLILLGAIAAIAVFPISGGLLDTLPIGFSSYSRHVAPWLEEIVKGVVVIGLFATNRIGFKLDGAISGFAIGVGFAVVENMLYLSSFAELGLGVWLVRGFGTAVMHGGATALFAVISHELTERQSRSHAARWRLELVRYLPGLMVAASVHLIFNQFPDQPMLAMLGSLLLVPLTLLMVFRFGEAESREWLVTDSSGHRARLETLQREGFAGDESGSIREALERRFHGRVPPGVIEEYIEVHTQLVLRAEARLQGLADGKRPQIDDDDRAALARFAELKKQLGKAVLAALAPSLPFSRNDLWEVREYEADVRAG